jgi:L-gulonate 5-dehydrogenase
VVAVVVEKPHALAVTERASETPDAGELLVAVERAGICGSDMHILHGANPFATYPRIVGHEFSGRVAAIGPGTTGFATGERVVIDPVIPCGKCHPCRAGRHNVCARLVVLGVHRDGGFRSRVVVPARNAVKVPAGMSAAIAALAEPYAVAANVLSRTGCRSDDVVLIYGAGTVGITVLQVAKLQGARCIVTDIDDKRLARAAAFGADLTLNPRHDDVPAAVSGELDGLGPSVVIDGAGVPALFAEACKVAAPAGRIGLLGFSTEPSALVQKEIVGKELSVVGSRLNRGFLPRVVEWLASGRLQGAAMITQTFAATEARAAFDLIEQHPEQTMKVQLAFD